MFVGFRIGMGLEPSSLPVGCLERMDRLTFFPFEFEYDHVTHFTKGNVNQRDVCHL